MAKLLWQSMKLEYFIQLVTRDKLHLTLQSLWRKSDYEEFRPHDRIRRYITDWLEKSQTNERIIDGVNDNLDMHFKRIDKNTYLCCFYDVNVPSANLVKLFGGDTGVSVGFNKDSVIRSVEREKQQPSFNILDHGPVKYVSGAQNALIVKINEIYKQIKLDESRNLRWSPHELRDLLIGYLFEKSRYLRDEREYRIVLGIEPETEDVDDLQSIPLESSAIDKIAVRSEYFSAMKPVINFLSNKSHFSFSLVNDESYDHPLRIYNRVYR